MKYLILFLLLISCSPVKSRVNLSTSLSGDKVNLHISLTSSDTGVATIYCSTTNLDLKETIDLYGDPVVKWEFPFKGDTIFQDIRAPHGTTLYYYVRIDTENGAHYSAVESITTTPRILMELEGDLAIVIDKKNYILSIYQNRNELKRYPINLGAKPTNRKLHYDNMSTPEGIYKISYYNEESAFHRSIWVSYPNSEDRRRYRKAKESGELPLINGKIPHIGGSITIHGGGVGNNWTWGCIAMNNDDLDEIREFCKMPLGTPILIGGFEYDMTELISRL